MQSGDFIKDLDIEIVLRSGHTDLGTLQKLQQAIVASVTSLVDTEIVMTESEISQKSTSKLKLRKALVLLQTTN